MKKSKPSSDKSASPGIKRRASRSAGDSTTAADDSIAIDSAQHEDLYVFTAADMISRLVREYVVKFDSSYITSYILDLLLEALTPEAPRFSKEQAQNQLQQMSGAVGERETVELVKFVQAAGRISNEVLVQNGTKELERLERERQLALEPDKSDTDGGEDKNESLLESPRSEKKDIDPDVTRVRGVRGTLDTRAVPAASTNAVLRGTLADQQKTITEQQQRIAELEALLASHRPIYDSFEQKVAVERRPEAVLKKAAHKGVVVKKGRSTVTFVDGEDDAAAIRTQLAERADALAPGSAVAANSSKQPVVRYEATREEVIAAARALAAEARRVTRVAAGELSTPVSASPRPLRGEAAPMANPSAVTQSYADHGGSSLFQSPYMHDISQHDSSSSRAALAAPAVRASPYAHLATAPFVVLPSASADGCTPAGTASHRHSSEILPLNAQPLTSEAVVRLITDKRPISVQSSETFSAWYQYEQERRARMLVDLGESSLIAGIQEHCALNGSRMSGAAHSLHIERQYTRLHQAAAASQHAPSFSPIAMHTSAAQGQQRTGETSRWLGVHRSPPPPSFGQQSAPLTSRTPPH